MTDIQVLQWIKTKLSPYIVKTIGTHPGTFCTEPMLAGLTMRETGGLIAKHSADFPAVLDLGKHMKGDYSDRHDGKGLIPHGYGWTQIDINAFPWFINSGDWLDAYKCYSQTIAVLEGNAAHLLKHFPVLKGSESLIHYSIAAYNCGAGNEDKAIFQHLDPDCYTTGHNYAKAVDDFAKLYIAL